MRNGAQVAPDMTGETSAGGVGSANVGWNATGKGFANEMGVSGANLDNGRNFETEPKGVREQEYNAQRARGIGGLAMGQVLTYNPEAADHARSEVGAPEFEAVQGRNTSEMMGVAGENLRQLEHLPEQMRMQNERVREQVELENGYARNEIAPNLSSVGLASKVEQAEYQAADLANAEGELAPATFEDEIQNKGQEEVGKAMAIRIGKLLKRKSFRPKDAVEWRDKGMLQMFERFKNKRVFKERNG